MTTFAGRYDEVMLRRASAEPNALVRALTGVEVTVFEDDGLTLAELYTDRTRTSTTANPFAPGDGGNLEFFAAPGTYVLDIKEGGATIRLDTVTVAPDPAEIDTTLSALEARADTLEALQFNVADFGAVGDGVTDDTAAIQAALNSGGKTVIPPGATYRVDGTLTVPVNTTLEVAPGATLKRLATDAGTGPVVLVSGNYAALTGQGLIKSDKVLTDRGVVEVGHVDGADAKNMNWWTVSGVVIEGPTSTPGATVGLRVQSIGTGSNFNGAILAPTIRWAKYGLQFDTLANGHTVSDVRLHKIGTAPYHFRGSSDISVFGGFVHQSTDVTTLLFEGASYVACMGVGSEPGGAAAKLYGMDAGTSRCTVVGYDNHSTVGSNAGTNNCIITSAAIRTSGTLFAGNATLGTLAFTGWASNTFGTLVASGFDVVSRLALSTKVAGDANARWQVTAEGALKWGNGTDVVDVTLSRDSATKALKSSRGLMASEDVEVTDTTKGVILRAPDASRWRVTINNAGQLTSTKVV